MPDGSCADQSDVAYVSSLGTATGPCTAVEPCSTVARALTMARAVVKLTGTLDEQITVDTGVLTILGAPGARLTSRISGTIVTVSGPADVTISGLHLGDDVLTPAEGAQTSTPGARLVLDRVTITGSAVGAVNAIWGTISIERSRISHNPGGGIKVSSSATDFSIRNNFILFNGRADVTTYGGVGIAKNSGGALEFNTIAFNESSGQRPAGIYCSGGLNSATGNLVYGNKGGAAGSTNDTQYGGNCAFGNSIKLASGSLGFVNPPPGGLDFHLTASSPASIIDAGGDCTGLVTVDIDGDPRPNGLACDIGADELAP